MSKRVLYIVPDLIGPPSGIARYCRMVCKSLLAVPCDLTVVSLIDEPGARDEAVTAFPGMAYWPCQYSRSAFIRKTIELNLRLRPDLVLVGHANFSPLGWAIARMTGAKMVTFLYGVDAWIPLSTLRRRGLHHSDQLISISRFTAQRAYEVNGISLSKTHLLYNCLDPGFEQPAHVAQVNSDLSLLTVARISLADQYKGHDKVILALPALLTRFPQLVYHIVGDGNGRPALEDLAEQVGVAHAVCFHGVVSEASLRQHYVNASVFIMPSSGEGFGFVFVEAMAQGLPVIGGNADATPEVVVDGETGYLVNPTSVDEVVEAVTRLLADEELRKRMGRAARNRVAQLFSYPSFKTQLASHLSALVPDLLE